ncbi:hypothetical protein DL771_010012 [Monosporascus sp. 5C6A]|nr:hypothetical protein DL771_010012 [Monosporascus sp. 5C6A]
MICPHAIDRCAASGRRGHDTTTRTVLVGYACREHSEGGGLGPPKPKLEDSRGVPGLANEGPVHNSSGGQTKARTQLVHSGETSPPVEHTAKLEREVPTPRPISEPARNFREEHGEHDEPRNRGADAEEDEEVSSVYEPLFDNHAADEISSATSLSSVETSQNVAEALTGALLYDEFLQFLWPQLILGTGSAAKAREQIAQLILRYSLDLEVLARKGESQSVGDDATALLRASRFVKRNRQVLASEICEEFWLPGLVDGDGDGVGVAKSSAPTATTDNLKDDKNDGGLAEFGGNFVALKQFLLDSEPFYCFRDNIGLLVAQPLVLPLQIGLLDTARRWFENFTAFTFKPKIQPGMTRLSWTCGSPRFHIPEGEVERGERELQRLIRVTTDLESNVPQVGSLVSGTIPPQPTQPKATRSDLRLPWHWQNRNNIEPGRCRLGTGVGNNEGHNYILALVPFGRWVSKIIQPEVCTVTSDRDFFSLLRLVYRDRRGLLSLSWLRRVKGIHFVQFDLYRDEITDVRSRPALPPAELKGQYVYDPMPADLVPPIGPNLLVHFFENPTHAGVLPDLYRRVPKKLREKLVPCPKKGSSPGWGIEFVEGVDTFALFLCGCACFLLCLLVAAARTVARDDVQGGFGIGGFLLAFAVFCGGIVHSALNGQGSV